MIDVLTGLAPIPAAPGKNVRQHRIQCANDAEPWRPRQSTLDAALYAITQAGLLIFTRNQVADATGLHKRTAGDVLDALESRGQIERLPFSQKPIHYRHAQ